MNAQDFERKMNGLLMLIGSFRTDALFRAEMQDMIHDLGLQSAMGDPVVVMGRAGALGGVLAAQQRWLENECERLIAGGKARWVRP